MQSVAETPTIDECAALPPEVQAWRTARAAWPQLMTGARSHALLAFSAWVFSEVEAGRSVDPADARALSDLADSHGVRTVEFLREAFAAGLHVAPRTVLHESDSERALRLREVEAAERAAAALERQAAPFAVANDAAPTGPEFYTTKKGGPHIPGKSRDWMLDNVAAMPGAYKPVGKTGKPGRDWVISRADYERCKRGQDTERCRSEARPEAEAIALSTLRGAGLRPTR